MAYGLEYYGIVLLALAALFGAMAVAGLRMRGGRASVGQILPVDDRTVFLFEEGDLLDATPKAHSLLRSGDAGVPERDRIVALLSPLFPGISLWMRDTQGRGRYRVQAVASPDGAPTLLAEAEVEYLNGRVRLTLFDAPPVTAAHPLAIAAMEDELMVLRRMSEETDELAWAEDAHGVISWANASYLALADERASADPATALGQEKAAAALPVWPPEALFPQPMPSDPSLHSSDRTPPGPDGNVATKRRVCLGDTDADETLWFDIRSVSQGGQTMHFARDARALVAAEKQGHMFVQTVAKTFAQLSIGLAIFDKKQRLSTFNPAFLDLTGLPVTFLSVRPTLGIILDRLREAGILQEPRDYKSWKQGVTDLIDAATQGTYCETWTQPGGQTYRVSGRPHPGGAIALLFEDISAEMTLARAFRAQIETSQAVLDTIEDAICVFSAAGSLTTCNDAFETLWSPGPGAGSLDQVTFAQALEHWKSRAVPTPLWDTLRSAAAKHDGAGGGTNGGANGGHDATADRARAEISGEVRLADGRAVTCRFDPMPAGAALFRFSPPHAGGGRTKVPVASPKRTASAGPRLHGEATATG